MHTFSHFEDQAKMLQMYSRTSRGVLPTEIRMLETTLPQIPMIQVWKTPAWRRVVPEGVLHVNWDPFRPRRSKKLCVILISPLNIATTCLIKTIFSLLCCSEEDLNYILNPRTRTLVCMRYDMCLKRNISATLICQRSVVSTIVFR